MHHKVARKLTAILVLVSTLFTAETNGQDPATEGSWDEGESFVVTENSFSNSDTCSGTADDPTIQYIITQVTTTSFCAANVPQNETAPFESTASTCNGTHWLNMAHATSDCSGTGTSASVPWTLGSTATMFVSGVCTTFTGSIDAGVGFNGNFGPGGGQTSILWDADYTSQMPSCPLISSTTGNEGTGNEGTGNEGTANEGAGNEGTGNEGAGCSYDQKLDGGACIDCGTTNHVNIDCLDLSGVVDSQCEGTGDSCICPTGFEMQGSNCNPLLCVWDESNVVFIPNVANNTAGSVQTNEDAASRAPTDPLTTVVVPCAEGFVGAVTFTCGPDDNFAAYTHPLAAVWEEGGDNDPAACDSAGLSPLQCICQSVQCDATAFANYDPLSTDPLATPDNTGTAEFSDGQSAGSTLEYNCLGSFSEGPSGPDGPVLNFHGSHSFTCAPSTVFENTANCTNITYPC
eukprot:COSAG05_NODE_2820_length_2604_cov_41.578044_1_plen_459_part_10